jgi:hypothetical protein
MPSTLVTLPSPANLQTELRYLAKYTGPSRPDPVLVYLHRVRIPSLVRAYPDAVANLERQYQDAIPQLTKGFVALLAGEQIDLIVATPSSRRDVVPYHEAVRAAYPGALDLTDAFRKAPTVSATTATSSEAVDRAITTEPVEVPPTARRVLIVDDIFSSGRTAAAIVARLRANGLQPNATVLIAAPLWVMKA